MEGGGDMEKANSKKLLRETKRIIKRWTVKFENGL